MSERASEAARRPHVDSMISVARSSAVSVPASSRSDSSAVIPRLICQMRSKKSAQFSLSLSLSLSLSFPPSFPSRPLEPAFLVRSFAHDVCPSVHYCRTNTHSLGVDSHMTFAKCTDFGAPSHFVAVPLTRLISNLICFWG